MKNAMFFLLLLLPLLAGKCFKEPPESAADYESKTLELSKCIIDGNRAYIPVRITGYDYAPYVLPLLTEFEKQKKVDITCYSTQTDDSQAIIGIWVTF